MHHLSLTVIAALVAAAFCLTASAADDTGSTQGKTLYHVVSVKFKEGADADKVKAAEDAFAALKTKIPGITSLHWGTNVSPENKNKGFTHCFVLTFASDKDRDAYLVHPDHKALGRVLGPVLADVMVVDFWAKE
jgi:hypothetical protein